MSNQSPIANRQSPIEDALRTYPLAPPPRTLAPVVMARIRAASPPPRFRLEWMDLALGLFGATMAGFAYGLWQSITPQAAAQTTAQIQLQVILWQQQFSALAVSPLLLVGAVVGVGGGVVSLVLLAASLSLAPRWRA